MTRTEAAPEREGHRPVRSYVRREGRMTEAQKRGLEQLWPRYGIDAPSAPLSLPELFGRDAHRVLEIGFGNGEHLLGRARTEPQHDFIGVEVHRPGVGRLLNRAAAADLANLRVACADAVEVLRDWLPSDCLDEVLIYFPDPWPKKRHHKRRLVQPAFTALAASRLRREGVLKLATDWEPYAEQMLEVLAAEPQLRNLAAGGGFMPRPAERAVTHFEARGTRLGHAVFDLAFARVR